MIVFNALQTSLNGGIGRYSYELAKGLYSLKDNNIKLVIRNQDLQKFNFVKKEDLIIAKNINNSIDRNIYEQFKLPRIIKNKYPNAIIHYPDTMAPLLARNPVIITVHDLAFKSVREYFTRKQSIWKNLITNLSVRKAKKIIAITNFTKQEILNYYPKIDKEKISVVYNGFNNLSNEAIIEGNLRNKIMDIKKPYILTVSTISPRKNIDGLVKAFNKIKDNISENLVIVGNNGWMYENVYELVESLNLQDRVIFTGKINDDELKYLYSNCKIFTYISFYEGFGLPPLEAMSYNKTCLVSNTSSIPEVVGQYAVKVDPRNIEEISDSLVNLLNDNINLEFNEYLSKFSWEKCSRDTFFQYKSLINKYRGNYGIK